MRGRTWLTPWALSVAIAWASSNGALALPPLDLEAPAYTVNAACASGQKVRVGLAPAPVVAVRNVPVSGPKDNIPWLTVEATPWIGTVYESGSAVTSSNESESAPTLNNSNGWCLRDSAGHLSLELTPPATPGFTVWEVIYRQEDGSYISKAYRGELSLRAEVGGKVRVINTLPLESYLSGVVPSEVPARFHVEALRSMACVARTYTLSHLGAHRAQGFDLCDSVHCQVYGGLKGESAKVNEVVKATAGKVLSYGGHPIDATYHAVCGGWGEAPQNVWDGRKALPYLQARPDIISDKRTRSLAKLANGDGACFIKKSGRDGKTTQVMSASEKLWRSFIDDPPRAYCDQATRYRWEQSYTPEDLLARLRVSLPQTLNISPEALGDKLDVRVVRRAPGGRVAELLIATERGEYRVGGDKVRWLTSGGKIGAEGLKSSFFYVTRRDGLIVFRGCGWGHGVGLCQEGAQKRALAGHNYTSILHHYYPGATLNTL